LDVVDCFFAEKDGCLGVFLLGKKVPKVELHSPEQLRLPGRSRNSQSALIKGFCPIILTRDIIGLCQIVKADGYAGMNLSVDFFINIKGTLIKWSGFMVFF